MAYIVEVAINLGNFAARYGVKVGDRCEITKLTNYGKKETAN